MESSPLSFFQHEKFGSLRVVRSEQGAQWFVAKDVCGCLGLDTSNLSKMLDEDELSTYPVQYTDQVRNLSVVSEPGLYSLILRSRKPEAKAFKRWVTHEVIPSIRKRGLYATEAVMDRILDDPDFGISLLQQYKFEREQRKLVEAQRDEAIRTKAEIGSRREATAMATASAAVRKATALENELGRGRDYKAVKGISWFLNIFADTPAAYSVAGRKLSDMSRRMGYDIREIEDSRFGSVKAYHVAVIEAFRLALRNDLNMLGKYRIRRAA